jgi:hypothetical protein
LLIGVEVADSKISARTGLLLKSASKKVIMSRRFCVTYAVEWNWIEVEEKRKLTGI